MKLLQLRSDNPKFKTLNFFSGLNIVAGLQLSKEEKQTFNGIGKSLSLKLIHYMFGSTFNIKDSEARRLKSFLSGYGVFYLSFIHKEKKYTIKKDFSKPDYYINGEKINQTAYPSRLKEIFFGDQFPISFRQIFNCFARRFGGTYYSNVLTQQGRPHTDYHQRLTNLFLLGIKTELLLDRLRVQENLKHLEKASKVIKGYGDALDKTNLKDLKDDISRLYKQKANFIIAENYDSMKKQADDLTVRINEIRNAIFFDEKKKQKKEGNLISSENINIDPARIEKIFKEADFFFSDQIVKRLEDAQKFHNTLVVNRKRRLKLEIKELEIKLTECSKDLRKISEKRDGILKDLDNSGALEELNSISARIKSLEAERDDLEKYEKLLTDFKKDKSKLDLENMHIKDKSMLYLDQEREHISFIEDQFRVLVKRFYDDSGGSFDVVGTETAKYLFDIDIHVPKEGSQGVGEAKIFCYDVLLCQLNKNLLGFLAHDGCIFSEMDPRQKSTILKIVLELIQNGEFQYFLNVGENTLKEILDKDNKINILNENDKKQIEESVIISLYDKNPKNWLFGEKFS